MRITLARTIAVLALAAAAGTLSACDIGELGTSRALAGKPAPIAKPALPAQTVPSPAAPTPAKVAPRSRPAPRPARPAKPQLRAKISRAHGTLVVDVHGMTLYRSDKDRSSPSRSRCLGSCTRTWKPLVVTTRVVRVVGIDPSIVGTVARPGGPRQLTIAGWPIYRFAHDRKPGDVAGQCRGGFFAVTPEGRKSM